MTRKRVASLLSLSLVALGSPTWGQMRTGHIAGVARSKATDAMPIQSHGAHINALGTDQFNFGDIFITLQQHEGCAFGVEEMILRVNPGTGEGTPFATTKDGLCYAGGLRFAPDFSQLFVLNWLDEGLPGGSVRVFNPDGTGEVFLDVADGINSPIGANGVAFGPDGYL